MEKSPISPILICFAILAVFALIITVDTASASSYYKEFNQIEGKTVIKNKINGESEESYVSEEELEKRKGGYYFISRNLFNDSYSQAEFRLNLDVGFIAEKDNIFPENYEIQSDGERISIIWKTNDVKKEDTFAMFVKIKNTEESHFLFWISADIIFILLIFALYLIYRRMKTKHLGAEKKKTTRQKNTKSKLKEYEKEGEYNYLLDPEKKVIDGLKKADRNELWQKQIQNSTGFSKAKISRLVRNLESRGLITKIPFGNTNKIRLKV